MSSDFDMIDGRLFKRQSLKLDVRLTPLSIMPDDTGWDNKPVKMNVETADISAGGAQLDVDDMFDESTFLLIKFDVDDADFPKYVLSRLLWNRSDQLEDSTHFRYGIKFLTCEEIMQVFSGQTFANLPPEVFEFDSIKQEALDRYLEGTGNQPIS